jgi:hypothetical protein
MAKPKPGDTIYVEGTIYLHHGADDFWGGVCTVKAIDTQLQSSGEESTGVEIEEDPGTWHRWEGYLEVHQEEWKKEYRERRGHHKPDLRPEFNDDREVWPDDSDS